MSGGLTNCSRNALFLSTCACSSSSGSSATPAMAPGERRRRHCRRRPGAQLAKRRLQGRVRRGGWMDRSVSHGALRTRGMYTFRLLLVPFVYSSNSCPLRLAARRRRATLYCLLSRRTVSLFWAICDFTLPKCGAERPKAITQNVKFPQKVFRAKREEKIFGF